MILDDTERSALLRIDTQHFDAAYLNQRPLSRLHTLGLVESSDGALALTQRGEDVVRLLREQGSRDWPC